MILITKRKNIIIILTPTIVTNPLPDTRETTTVVEGTSTRMITMSNQQTSKSPSLDQSKKTSCFKVQKPQGLQGQTTKSNWQLVNMLKV